MKNNTRNIVKVGFARRRSRFIIVTSILSILVLILCLTVLLFGKTIYPLQVVLRVITGEKIDGATFTIMTLRLPRMLSGLLVGVAFGIAGSTFQTMLRNPLASPDIIGITSGSSAAAVFCILVLKRNGSIVSFIAVITGLLVALLIYMLSKGGGFSGGKLILIGIGVQAMLNAVISFLLLKASQYDVPVALRWLSGSLNGIRIKEIPLLLLIVVIFSTLIVLLGKQLKILELGEEFATTLGLRVNIYRLLLILSSVFLIAFATAVTGPIAFIAFLSGPIATRLVGSGGSNQIPSGLVGAILVLAGDLIGQFAFGSRFPVGVITGILGSPYLIYLLIRMNKGGGTS